MFFYGILMAQSGMGGAHDFMVYYSPDGSPYIENYFWINGQTVTYNTVGNKKKAAIEVVVMFSQKGKVVSYDKYVLESEEYDAKDSVFQDFLDMRRYQLPKGDTEFELFITDLNKKTSYIEKKDTIHPHVTDGQTSYLSAIEFVEMYAKTGTKNNFSKAGYDILPYVGALYQQDVKKLTFYTELYDTDKDFGQSGKYLLTYYLENLESGRQLENFTVRKRETATDVKSIFAEFNIEKLAAGNYKLVVEVRDSANKYVAQTSRVFRRENSAYDMKEEDFATLNIENTFVSLLDKDSLDIYIRMLKPISSETEYLLGKNVIKNGDPTFMKRYLLSFWIKRNNQDPYNDFRLYCNVVKMVHKVYGNPVTEGYNTDRGRIFLKYGQPDKINQRYNEANTYPYEIWQYYQLHGQNNVRFVFYNKDMVSDDFVLLHSDLRGEIQNKQWEMFLRQRNTIFGVDDTKPSNDSNTWSDDLYNQPR